MWPNSSSSTGMGRVIAALEEAPLSIETTRRSLPSPSCR
jgi:hypothetical protein